MAKQNTKAKAKKETTEKTETKRGYKRSSSKAAQKAGTIKRKAAEPKAKKTTKKTAVKKSIFDAKLLKEIDGNFTDGVKEETTIKRKNKEGEVVTETKELVRYSKLWWKFKYKECQTAKQKLEFVDKFNSWVNSCKKDLPKMKEFQKLSEAIENL